MATYEEIYGKRVKEFDSDPTLDDTYEGQVWYDKSSGVLKTIVKSAVVSSAANMPTGTRAFGSIGNTSEAYIAAAGANPGTNYSTTAYEYDGSSWSGIPAVTYSRDSIPRGSLGTTSAGIVFGGMAPTIRANTELWNGSSWSESGDLSDSRGSGQSFGTQTSCVTTGGYNEYSPPYWTNATEEFNGSSWTSGTATPLNTINGCGVGTSTAGIIIGQQEHPSNSYPGKSVLTQTKNYDGSAWTNGGVINMATNVASVAGTSSSCRKAGGASPAPASYTNQEEWDGSTWTTGGALVSDLSNGGGAGTAVSAVFSGGQTPPGNLTTTQEVVKQAFTTTAAAWASSGNLNTGRNAGAGFGIQTAAVMTTGNIPPESNATEEYNGATWTSVNNYPISKRFVTSCGTLTAGLVASGSPYVATVNKYDGTNFSSAEDIPTATDGGTMFGTQTAAVYSVGRTPATSTGVTTTYQFDGTNWTSGGAAGTARYFLDSSGTSTAGLMFGGQTPGPTARNETEEYDGTSFSEQNNLGTARYGIGSSSAGTQTDTIGFAGGPGALTATENYDGSSWSTTANMGTGRRFVSGAGTATAGLVFGGNPPNNSTEEFTAAFNTFPASTLTTS